MLCEKDILFLILLFVLLKKKNLVAGKKNSCKVNKLDFDFLV